MKKVLIGITFMFIAFIAGMVIQKNRDIKYYEMSCILKDVINNSIDLYNSGYSQPTDLEEIYEETMWNLDCYDTHCTKEDFEKLYWCY